jgi:hypothetical protein
LNGTFGGDRVGVATELLAESCHPDLTIGLMVLLNIIPLQLQQPLPEPNPIDRARGDLAKRDDVGLSPTGDTSRFPRGSTRRRALQHAARARAVRHDAFAADGRDRRWPPNLYAAHRSTPPVAQAKTRRIAIVFR